MEELDISYFMQEQSFKVVNLAGIKMYWNN